MCCCKNRELDSFEKAYSFNKHNTFAIGLYFLTFPLVNLVEYIVEKTETMKIGDFSFTLLTRLYVLVITLFMIFYIESFVRSFTRILPFVPMKNQIGTVMITVGVSSLLGGILRTSQAEVGPYDEFETYQLLYI